MRGNVGFSGETCLDSASCLVSGAETIIETHDGKVRMQVDNESRKVHRWKKQRVKYLVVTSCQTLIIYGIA